MKRLAASGLAQSTFKVAVFWLGDLFSGRLHHEAETIEFGGRSFSVSTSLRCASELGLKWPEQGTKRRITAYVRGWMRAFGSNSASKFGLSEQSFSNLDFDSAESNSSRTDGLSNIETLRTARDGGTGAEPSSAGGALMSNQSLNMPLNVRWASIDLSLGGSSGAKGP